MLYYTHFFILLLIFSQAENALQSENETQPVRKYVKLSMKQGLIMNQVLAFYGIEKTGNPQCKKDVEEWKNGLRAFEPWALQMFDASSKIQSGILGGNLMEFGAFKQCVNIKHLNFVGKHCLLKITPPLSIVKTIVMFRNLSEGAWTKTEVIVDGAALYWSVCVPHTCSHSDVLYHFNKSIVDVSAGLNLEVSLEEKFCVTLDDYPKMGSTQYITLIFLGSFVLVCVVATIMEMQQNDGVFVDTFSTIKNFKRIISEGTASDFDCVHGIRTLSTFYVVMGHRYLFAVFFPLTNTLDIIDWTTKLSSTFIIAGGVSVDTFFFLSGFLISFGFFKYVTTSGKFNLFVFYIRRYIRITFPFAIGVLFYATMLEFLGNGPLYLESVRMLKNSCRYFWWSALLHIQNYINPGTMCIVQTWYLSCEMLYYYISPIVLIPLWKSPKLGYVIYIFFYLLSIAINFYVAWINKFDALFPISNKSLTSDYFKYHYISPHCRAAPYIIGIGFGYILFQQNGKKIKTSFLINLAGWLMAAFLMLSSVMGVYWFLMESYDYNRLQASLFLCLSRSVWTFGLAWIIWNCVNGQGGILNAFFSMYGFKVLGRLSYGIFLFHICFQFVKHSNEKIPLYFSNFHAIHQGFGDVVVMLFIGFFFTIFYELPIIRLENLMFKPAMQNKKIDPQKQ